MENLTTPQIISGAFAYDGQKTDIPDAPTGTAHASIQEGFPPITMISQEDGGEAPYGQDFNGLGNLLSQFYFYKQNGGMYTFEPEVSEKIGGYPLNALLWYFPENGVAKWLRSTKANNTDNFITNPEVIGTSWVEAATNASLGAVGDIRYTCRTQAPAGSSFCDGSTHTKTEFPTVWDMLTGGDLQVLPIAEYNSKLEADGSCGYFGIDTSAETFRVPSLNNIYIKAGAGVPDFAAETLPNLTGHFSGGNYNQKGLIDGAFSSLGSASDQGFDGGADRDHLFNAYLFDASASSSVYQNQAKVNPDHIVYRAYVILATEFTEVAIDDYKAVIEEQTNQSVAEINSFAAAKTDDFNNNAAEKQTAINNSAALAQDWAVKTDAPVDGEDYSAKYYALQAQNVGLPLLMPFWSDHLLNDISFLRADTFSWQSGEVYVAAYQHLQTDIEGVTAESETIGNVTITFYRATDGHKIVLANMEANVTSIYNATGVAWYYILDTTNTRFKLPRTRYSFVGVRDSVGNYVPESLPNITGGIYTGHGLGLFGPDTATGAFNRNYNEYQSRAGNEGSSIYAQGFDFNASRVSATYQDGAPVQQRATEMYLYFYVGNYEQTAVEQTAGLNTELFNGKADVDLSNANPSQAFKNTVMGWFAPDYDSALILSAVPSASSPFVAPADGYYLACIEYKNGSSYIYVNNIESAFYFQSNSNSYRDFYTHTIPLAKGDSLHWNYTGGTPVVLKFVPVKGAN